jgi:hypothetical protein
MKDGRVMIGEQHTFSRNTIDVRSPITHDSATVNTEVRRADIITPDNDDVRSFSVCPRLSSDVLVADPRQGDERNEHRSKVRSFHHHETSSSVNESNNTT